MTVKFSLDKDKIKVLLLEGVHPNTVETFRAAGYTNVEYLKTSLSEEELIERIRDVHFVGLRSRTQITEKVLDAATRLVAIGCFCIGTNQVSLDAAHVRGIPVFNAPFSNTRSVAELVLGEILLLLRGIPEKNAKCHRGVWEKLANRSVEARGKKLGIIGYGHIGTQLGIIAEMIGMKVYYYDIENKLSLGNAIQVPNLVELLNMSDVISLHVPETASTKDLIGAEQLRMMKPGAIFINASRGTVVDIDALADVIKSGHLSGAAIDVFPVEPTSNAERFVSPLQGLPNVILTPHVGGSTEEAQDRIGADEQLAAEAAADIGRDQPDIVLGDAQRLGDVALAPVDHLVGGPEGQLAVLPGGDGRMRFHHRVRLVGRGVGDDVRTEDLPQFLMASLGEQVQIEFADARQKAIPIGDDEFPCASL